MKIHRTSAQELMARALLARRVQHRRHGGSGALHGPRGRLFARLAAYFQKMRGSPHAATELYPVEILWSFTGSFIGMGILSWCNYDLFSRTDNLLLMSTFGASCMLLFGAPSVPFAQPRNVMGGHMLSALIGIAVSQLLPASPHLAVALAVSVAIAAMHATGTLHPPGGGTALLMVTSGPEIRDLGFTAALFPVATGAAILIAVALAINNISRRRRYPASWW